MKHLSVFLGRLLALPTNIRLGLKCIARGKHTNLLQTFVNHSRKKAYIIESLRLVFDSKTFSRRSTFFFFFKKLKNFYKRVKLLASSSRKLFSPSSVTLRTDKLERLSLGEPLWPCFVFASKSRAYFSLIHVL